ncbi:hypothetical protein B5F40_07335 [Gordonibacter sp. An230]|uniref:hypothetical protein n=1 Tax=Gordonibacter sp. An230 TaxID=1965592 RepID=UPI000B3A9951|nr:hypothetical protein [Gordonibacter sp. An230]OUO90266.1 hypothetical protein B5F40_07335 [Gordonibacter sp. An230]
MTYRGIPYFVTRSKTHEVRADPYATEQRSLPNRTHGVSYVSSPRRTTRIRTYAPSESVRPATATPQDPPPGIIDLKRVLAAVLAMLLIVILSTFLGMYAARAASSLLGDDARAFASAFGADNETRAESLSAPRSTWEMGSVPELYQDDPQWADRPYGSSTIGTAGAAPVCLAMVRVSATGDVQTGPIDVASFSQRSGYADSPDATALLTDGAQELGLVASAVDKSEMALRREIVAGRPVIAAMDAGTLSPSITYVVLSDIDEHGRLVMNDPLSDERSSRHWTFDEVLSRTTALWSYASAD